MDKNKKAILAVSFGTSYCDSIAKTIDLIEQDMQKAWPDYKVYRAWTSKMIIRHLLKRDDCKINNVCEAMEQLQKDGISQVVVQPTHMINGVENDIMKAEVLKYKASFSKISFGNPLLTSSKDNENVILALMSEFSNLTKDEGILWMGHGTCHYANAVYAALDYTFKDMGYSHVFVGTVEAYPAIDTVLKALQRTAVRRVHLAPLMFVAGDHANHDMAGAEPDSWKSVLEQAGYQVCCHLKGLGEYQGIREIYLEHLKDAVEV